MTDVDGLLVLETSASGAVTKDVPDGWQQGRGAHGGVVMGLLTRAAEAVVRQEGRRVRTVSAHLASPVLPGVVSLHAETKRTGGTVSFASSRLVQNGETCASAVITCGADRAGATRRPPPPPLPDWREVPVLDVASLGGPPFAKHYDFRPAIAPYAGRTEAIAGGWVAPRSPPRRWDAASIAMLADAWWPAFWSSVTRPVPMATLACDVQLVEPCDDVDPALPLGSWGQCDAVSGGYASEVRTLWSADGRLLALSHQTLAVLG